MSAIDTAARVIEWALVSGNGRGAPPQGDVHSTEQLVYPPPSLCDALGQLTTLTAARLRLSMPPLEDEGPVGVGALIVAAAIGVASVPGAVRIVLSTVPTSKSPVEWVARHGVVSPAIRFLSDIAAGDCRIASPLTALLDHPVEGYEVQTIQVAQRFLEHPMGRLSLTLHLAQPTTDIDVRCWRHDLLDRWRLGNGQQQSFVLDIYEAAMIHHRQQVLEQVRAAREVLTNPIAASDYKCLSDALSVADWWEPLWAMERENVDALRARRYLDYAYREGIALFRLAQKFTGGLA